MKPRGTYKLRYRRTHRRPECGTVRQAAALWPDSAGTLAAADGFLARLARSEHRVSRILASLRDEILEGGGGPNLRIRRVLQSPREVFRLELELPELGYQRTTFLDRDALEELLEEDDVRDVVQTAALGG